VIVGEVKPSREALIRLALAGPAGRRVELDAIIDTGFTDFLTVPRQVIEELGLRFRESMAYELANGDLDMFDLYEGKVLWDGRWREVIVSLAEGGPLVGMGLMEGCRLSVDVTDGGRVEIRPLGA
jgi:clan AA aspartic protease